MHEPNASSASRSTQAPPGLHAENDAASQADRVAAETLIRTTVQSVGNGSVPQDLDELVRRNAGRVTREDLRAGRLGSTILGDIINSVEQAKGNTAINWSAATPQQIKAYAMAHGLDAAAYQRMMGMQGAGADKESDSGRSRSTGNRFAEIDKTLMQARDVAIAHNMPWVANNPELLRLGPAAVQTLADVHFSKESYERLKCDVSFTAKDTVALAKFAKEKKVDANDLSTTLADVGQGLSKDEKAQLRAGVVPYLAKPADPAAQKAAGDALAAVGRVHPEKKPAVERAQRMLNVQTGAELRQRNAESKQLNQEASSAVQSAANFDALNGGGDEAKPATGKSNSAPTMPPTTKATEAKSGTATPAQRQAATPKAPSPGKS